MPWKVSPVPDLRLALGHAVRSAAAAAAAAAAAREFGVSRKTAHKWLARFDAAPATGGGTRTTPSDPTRPSATSRRPPPPPAQRTPAARRPARPRLPRRTTLRVVSDSGQVSVDDVRVRVEDRGNELAVFYCRKEVRCLPRDQLVRGKVL